MSTVHYHTCDRCRTSDDPRNAHKTTVARNWVLVEGEDLVPAHPTAIIIPGDFCPECVAAVKANATPTDDERQRREERERAIRLAAEKMIRSAPLDEDPEWIFDLFNLADMQPSYEMRNALGFRRQGKESTA